MWDAYPINFVQVSSLKYCSQPETVPPISELGPDALFEPMSADNFAELLSKKKIGIKALLLDQVIPVESIENFASIIIIFYDTDN